jgi:radical SAM protein with 4Fe4S-binding SPASM domain
MVIKPTPHCNANCDGCASRKDLHRSLAEAKQLSLGQWKTLLKEAAGLGLQNLHISGGEPTLYPNLTNLIEEGKNLGMRVRINSNGSMITAEFARNLLNAGLDEICISIYSHEPGPHNNFRKRKNLWQKATRAVRIFSELRRKFPTFFLGTMTIILRENYRSLDKLIDFHRRLGSQQIGLSYLEGDFSGRYLLNKDEILEFRHTVVPKVLNYCRTLDPRIRNRAINAVKGLYSSMVGPVGDLSQGIYWQKRYCRIPQTEGLVMSNGDVHPCNIVEYTHSPVMGNLFENSFKDIWNSHTWGTYRKTLHQKCLFCPVNLYSPVPFTPTPDSNLLLSIYHSNVFAPFRPASRGLWGIYNKYMHRACQ